jgi:hypothetical protein
VGYRFKNAVPGDPCWALMMWEAPETYGDPIYWDIQYRDAETGLEEMGAFPRFGRHRLLRRMESMELRMRESAQMIETPFGPGMKPQMKRETIIHKVEPTGFILDLMVPMLLAWKSLGPAQKMAAVMEQKRLEDLNAERMTKDALYASKVRRGSALVAKRAELIEKTMDQALRIAAQYGPGMAQVR